MEREIQIEWNINNETFNINLMKSDFSLCIFYSYEIAAKLGVALLYVWERIVHIKQNEPIPNGANIFQNENTHTQHSMNTKHI